MPPTAASRRPCSKERGGGWPSHSTRLNRLPRSGACGIKTGKAVEVPRNILRYLTQTQQAQVLEHIPDQHLPIFMFLMDYGVRVGEACALAGLIFRNAWRGFGRRPWKRPSWRPCLIARMPGQASPHHAMRTYRRRNPSRAVDSAGCCQPKQALKTYGRAVPRRDAQPRAQLQFASTQNDFRRSALSS